MMPKPAHLGSRYASQFADPSVVAAYNLRPPYPDETFRILESLVDGDAGVVLDIGCGTGELARPLARTMKHVDALDPSPGLIEKGPTLPGGRAANIQWLLGSAEEAALDGPYSLIVAGASLHWTKWDVVLPRCRRLLASPGVMALVEDREIPNPWDNDLHALVRQFSTNREYQPFDLVAELEARSLFRRLGEQETSPVVFDQTLDEYVESFHARNGFSRDRMSPGNAHEFDRGVKQIVEPFCQGGIVRRQIYAAVVWGKPGSPKLGRG